MFGSNYWFIRCIDYFILVPVIIGIIRLRKIDLDFFPFLLLLFYDFTNELLFEILTRTIHTNSISSNVYVLVSFYILLFQLVRWGVIPYKKQIAFLVFLVLFLLWLIENTVFSSLWQFNPYNKILFAVCSIFLCLYAIGLSPFLIRKNEKRITVLIICIAWILKHVILIISEIFLLYTGDSSLFFQQNLINLVVFSCLLVNILYTIAVVWIPKKRKYTWLSH